MILKKLIRLTKIAIVVPAIIQANSYASNTDVFLFSNTTFEESHLKTFLGDSEKISFYSCGEINPKTLKLLERDVTDLTVHGSTMNCGSLIMGSSCSVFFTSNGIDPNNHWQRFFVIAVKTSLFKTGTEGIINHNPFKIEFYSDVCQSTKSQIAAFSYETSSIIEGIKSAKKSVKIYQTHLSCPALQNILRQKLWADAEFKVQIIASRDRFLTKQAMSAPLPRYLMKLARSGAKICYIRPRKKAPNYLKINASVVLIDSARLFIGSLPFIQKDDEETESVGIALWTNHKAHIDLVEKQFDLDWDEQSWARLRSY